MSCDFQLTLLLKSLYYTPIFKYGSVLWDPLVVNASIMLKKIQRHFLRLLAVRRSFIFPITILLFKSSLISRSSLITDMHLIYHSSPIFFPWKRTLLVFCHKSPSKFLIAPLVHQSPFGKLFKQHSNYPDFAFY